MKRWLCLLAVVLLLFAAAGCSYFSKKIPGEGATIYYRLPQSVTSIDPQTVANASARTVVHALYEGLCRVNAENELLPGVAERWEANADHTEYTFYLREDACWNNGEPVTADDFVFAFQRALNPNTGSLDVQQLFCIKNARAVYQGQAAAPLGVLAVDARTLRISLESPDEDFPYKTTQAVYMPCNRTFFEGTRGRYGLTYGTSCTNGPFDFVNRYSWEERRSISLGGSYTYTGTAVVRPAYVELTMGTESNDALATLLNGTADLCALPASAVAEAEKSGCTVTVTEDTVCALFLNPADPVLAKEEIRQRMLAALDGDALATLVGEASTGNIVPAAAVLGGSAYRAQVEDCRLPAHQTVTAEELSALLEKHGLEDMDSMMILCADDAATKALANEMVIAWNEAFGTYFNILPLAEEELQERLEAGDYQICIAGVKMERCDPYACLAQVTALCPEPTVLAQLQKADTPRELFAVEQALVSSGLVYPLWSENSYFAQAPEVSGAYVHALTALEFTDVLKTRK